MPFPDEYAGRFCAAQRINAKRKPWLAGLTPPKLRLVSGHGNRRAPSVLAGLASIVHDGENAAGANQHNHRCNNKDEAALHLRPRNCVSQTPTPCRFSETARERAMNAFPEAGTGGRPRQRQGTRLIDSPSRRAAATSAAGKSHRR